MHVLIKRNRMLCLDALRVFFSNTRVLGVGRLAIADFVDPEQRLLVCSW